MTAWKLVNQEGGLSVVFLLLRLSLHPKEGRKDSVICNEHICSSAQIPPVQTISDVPGRGGQHSALLEALVASYF